MVEPDRPEEGKDDPGKVLTLLRRLTDLETRQAVAIEEQSGLARQRTRTTTDLALYSSKTAENAEKQTGFAQERTALTREQTRLSTRSAELANFRTELAQERTFRAEDRTRLAMQRTDMAQRRTSLSLGRTRLAEQRNYLAWERTARAKSRTRLSHARTELARERTYLALIRTGLAFLTLGVTFFRYFGLSLWTLFDIALVILSSLMLYFGLLGYRRSKRMENKLGEALSRDRGMADMLQDDKTFRLEVERQPSIAAG